MTNKVGTKTRRYGATYGNTTTSKSAGREQEGWVTLENGKEVKYLIEFSLQLNFKVFEFKFMLKF